MESIPDEMFRKGRPIVSLFSPEEDLYIRFNQVDGNKVHPMCIRYPNQSVNRGNYSDPDWVLIPKSKFWDWGYGAFKVKDVPKALISVGGARNNLTVEHDPLEENYAHTEIRAYKNSIRVKNPNKSILAKFQVRLSQKIHILRLPVS
jgi:hypothetical protein